MTNETVGIKTYESDKEKGLRRSLLESFKNCPIPEDQLLSNLGLFLNSKSLSRILFMDMIYRKIVDVQGIVLEFGTRWGQNMALFSSLRGIYEPFNRHRKIVAFDTFEGFPSLSDKDGKSDMMKQGNLALTDKYQAYLDNLLSLNEADGPLGHIKKNETVAGDACKNIVTFLEKHPQTIVALAYFDFDLYEPTKKCLEAIKPHLTKGSIIGFDELNDPDSPGETIALREVFGLDKYSIKRPPITSRVSYLVVE
ncbi:MAG: hypothetical protein WC560_11325 [Syntrophales bacterium]